MSWSYRKRIKIIPGVTLNFSKQGISTTVGVKGASLNFSKQGTFLNTEILGTGIYQRVKINNGHFEENSINSYQNDVIFDEEEVFSRHDSLHDIEDSLMIAFEQKKEIENEIKEINSVLKFTKLKLFFCKILFLALLKKKQLRNFELQTFALQQLKGNLSKGFLNLDMQLSSILEENYDNLYSSYLQLCRCQKVWQIDNFEFNDTVRTRSSVGLLMDRKQVRFSQKEIDVVYAHKKPLNISTINGKEFFIYPCLIIAFQPNTGKFDVFPINEFVCNFSLMTYVENEIVPSDSKVDHYTWEKVNKNGSPDRRFSNNSQIPVARYGKLDLKFNNYYKFSFMFSNEKLAKNFEESLNMYLLN